MLQKVSKFDHNRLEHKSAACNQCHLRGERDPANPIPARPYHDACAKCHARENFLEASSKSLLCVVCHGKGEIVSVQEVVAVADFPKALNQFGLKSFSHQTRLDPNKTPAGAPALRCGDCHRFNDGLTVASFPGHRECYSCHVHSAGRKLSGCGDCHAGAASAMRGDKAPGAATRQYNFKHGSHLRQESIGSNCAACQTCIGCGDCATNCPYNAIPMASCKPVPPAVDEGARGKLRRWLSLKADPLPPPVKQSDELLAVKCNLCSGTPLNPPDSKTPAYSCEENCPTGALARVNPKEYFTEIKQIEGLAFLDKTHAIGRNIHKTDPLKSLTHLVGVSLVFLLNAGAIALLNRYGYGEPFLGPFNLRWVTGLAGLVGVAGVMAYAVRRSAVTR
jgi:Fe-S-cluster-containing hydrogenase component 2